MDLIALFFGGDDLVPRSLKKPRKFVPYKQASRKKKPFSFKRTWNRVTFKKTRGKIKRARRAWKRMRREIKYFQGQTPQALARKRGLAQAHRRRRKPVRRMPTRR